MIDIRADESTKTDWKVGDVVYFTWQGGYNDGTEATSGLFREYFYKATVTEIMGLTPDPIWEKLYKLRVLIYDGSTMEINQRMAFDNAKDAAIHMLGVMEL